jgi:hypothetical protein
MKVFNAVGRTNLGENEPPIRFKRRCVINVFSATNRLAA